MKLEDDRSKQWILAQYLNSVFYGNFAYGAEAAARTYFSRSARALTLPQAALLAGLTQAPSSYDPLADPKRALARRNEVLAAMRDQGMITQRQFRFARGSRIGLVPGRLYAEIREPYFFGYVRDELVRAYGAERVRSGGLQVFTTIQPRWQQLARQAIRRTLTEPNDPAAALISIDPATGAIRAMSAIVPGRANNQFNLLSQARRQPGSTFKLFVYLAALRAGWTPDSLIEDEPISIDGWSPSNVDGVYRGNVFSVLIQVFPRERGGSKVLVKFRHVSAFSALPLIREVRIPDRSFSS